jgi:hypothetical protein
VGLSAGVDDLESLNDHSNNWLVDRKTLSDARREDLKYATAEELAFVQIWSANGTEPFQRVLGSCLMSARSHAQAGKEAHAQATSHSNGARLYETVLSKEQLLRCASYHLLLKQLLN